MIREAIIRKISMTKKPMLKMGKSFFSMLI